MVKDDPATNLFLHGKGAKECAGFIIHLDIATAIIDIGQLVVLIAG